MSDVFDVDVRGPAKAVLTAIVWRLNGKDECWPSLDRLALDTGLNRATVCRALDELEDGGLIFRDRSEGGKPSTYSVNSRRLQQLTVALCNTKERERKKNCEVRLSAEAKADLDRAKIIHRRSEVKATFEALCQMYPEDVQITAPMVAREIGSPAAKVRSDLIAILKTGDIPPLFAMRFGRTKRNPRHFGKLKNVIPFQRSGTR
jgi:DNA-binding transcriptional regulator YhcF (GntR family)